MYKCSPLESNIEFKSAASFSCVEPQILKMWNTSTHSRNSILEHNLVLPERIELSRLSATDFKPAASSYFARGALFLCFVFLVYVFLFRCATHRLYLCACFATKFLMTYILNLAAPVRIELNY